MAGRPSARHIRTRPPPPDGRGRQQGLPGGSCSSCSEKSTLRAATRHRSILLLLRCSLRSMTEAWCGQPCGAPPTGPDDGVRPHRAPPPPRAHTAPPPARAPLGHSERAPAARASVASHTASCGVTAPALWTATARTRTAPAPAHDCGRRGGAAPNGCPRTPRRRRSAVPSRAARGGHGSHDTSPADVTGRRGRAALVRRQGRGAV